MAQPRRKEHFQIGDRASQSADPDVADRPPETVDLPPLHGGVAHSEPLVSPGASGRLRSWLSASVGPVIMLGALGALVYFAGIVPTIIIVTSIFVGLAILFSKDLVDMAP